MSHANAAAGDLIDVTLGDLHPTQPSLGYDEVFFRVGRYTLGTHNPLLDAWCVANGQQGVASADAGATVADRTSFTCVVPIGSETPETTAGMKTFPNARCSSLAVQTMRSASSSTEGPISHSLVALSSSWMSPETPSPPKAQTMPSN